jgi:hypothetical protein
MANIVMRAGSERQQIAHTRNGNKKPADPG